MPTSDTDAIDEVSRAAFELLLKEPFYAHVFAGMPRNVSREVATLGLSWDGQQISLQINPDYFLKAVNKKHRAGIIKQEILHVCFRHLFRERGRDRELFSIAADLVVTQLSKPWPLPEGYPALADFPELNLSPDGTVEDYYASLKKLLDQMLQAGYRRDSANDTESLDSTLRWAIDIVCPKSAERLAQMLHDAAKRPIDNGWVEGHGEMQLAGRYALGNLLLRARDRLPPHQWGTIPASLQSELALILAERQPKLDWKRVVRIFCASSGRTRIRHTIKRISKRYGTRPGIKVQRLKRLLVAIDTSGSIDDRLLKDFFVEIHGIWRLGATVVVVECDAQVQGYYEYHGKPPSMVKGGGGTAFEPVFEWMRTQRPFDGVLYLTDGYGDAPMTRPNCKLLWVLSGNRNDHSLPFGPSVEIPSTQGTSK